jgi:soluble lytic murein transglycosylase
MRGHALVLLVILALALPAAPASGLQPSPDADWDAAHQLVRRGDYARAQQAYSAMTEYGPPIAPRALLLQARTALLDGDTDQAEATIQQLLQAYPGSDQTAGAYFTLEQVRRAAGDCVGALRALDAFEASVAPNAIGPYPALQRAQCAAKLEDWQGELNAARNALSTDGGGPRLTRIEALERAAEAEVKLGRKQDALDFYNRSLELAGTRAYTAEMLFTTATIAHALGQDALAKERFRAVVVDYADQARAPGALDSLSEMGAGATVSPYQAGLARFAGKEYRTAIFQFDQVDPSSADWGPAQLTRVEALLKLGSDSAAREGLELVAASGTASAANALLRMGQLAERDGDWTSAEQSYQRLAETAPDRTAEALYHVGFTRFVRGDRGGAFNAWQTGMASGPPAPALQAQLLYWSGRADPNIAVEDFSQAAAIAPETYYGLRAQERLGSTLAMASTIPSPSRAWLSLTTKEIQERDAWLTSLQTTDARLQRDLASHPGLQRADALLELGLQTEASWEIDGVAASYAQAKDAAHLNALASWLTQRDLPQLGLKVGKQMRDMVGLSNLPRAAQKQVYPAGWGDLVAEQAAEFKVDPLLMLALIRQESSFDPRAQSGARALGLTQVVPSTARNIASRLGVEDDFTLRDLYRPGVSLQFGTWFMAQLLKEYNGRVFPALTAYNAGGGNVARWLQRFGDDPDVLVEMIPFAETQTYLRIVYDNYWHYQALYGTP